MKKLLILTFIILVGCAPIKYYTTFDGGFDPTFNVKSAKTIGLTPCYWTESGKKCNVDPLVEKQFLALAKKELENRGFRVFYISLNNLCQDSTGNINVKGLDEFPDLTLTTNFGQGLGNVVTVPGASYGGANWGQYGGGGFYTSKQSYNVQTYVLFLNYTLWAGKPEYREMVWRGSIIKGSPKLNLSEEMESMVSDLFKQEFDKEK